MKILVAFFFALAFTSHAVAQTFPPQTAYIIAGTEAPPLSCPANYFYLRNDATNGISQLYICGPSNTYTPANYGAGAVLPTNCAANQLFMLTTGPTLYQSGTGGSPCSWASLTSPSGSNAASFINFTTGPLTAVAATISDFAQVSKASTVDNFTASASTFTCSVNPVVTFYECGTSATCASPAAIGTATVTAAGTAVAATIASAAVTAGDYVAWALTTGTCTVLNLKANAQVHSN